MRKVILHALACFVLLSAYAKKARPEEHVSFNDHAQTPFAPPKPETGIPKEIQAETAGISGKIVDANGGGVLPGVSILVRGTTRGTVSDTEGRFTLEANIHDVLVFSSIGYEELEVQINNDAFLNITLTPDEKNLNEVVVVGYGVQNKATVTGSVSTIQGRELTVAPVASTANALVGRLPGLISIQPSGIPGGDRATVMIRGFGSPLVIVDGVQMDFNNVDPNQIESVSILKDGAASIFGARAGNGVLLITTKRGLNQKPTISVNSSFTLQGVTKMLKPASSGQLATLQREAHLNSGKPESTAPFTQEQIDKYFAGNDPAYPNTDWFGYTFRKFAPQSNNGISVSGGNEKLKYFGFLGQTTQATMVRKNGGDYKRYNAQSSISADITSNLKVALDFYMIAENRESTIRGLTNGGSLWGDYYQTLPWYPSELPDKSKIAWGGITTGSVFASSNMNILGYSRSTYMLTRGTTTLSYQFPGIPSLTAKAMVNYNGYNTYSKTFQKPVSYYLYNPNTDDYTLAGSYVDTRVSEVFSRGQDITQQYSLNYDQTFRSRHHVAALALIESIGSKFNTFNASRVNLLTPAIDQLFAGSSVGQGNTGSASEAGRFSYVGRLNYGFKEKYLVETILRVDASAKFPKTTRWGYFPSISVGWVLSEEPFMRRITAIDNLKLRASYGLSGNDAVGNFQYLAGYALGGNYIFNGVSSQSIYTTSLANPTLTWEKLSIKNAGFDFSLNRRKLFGSLDVFYRDRTGIPASRIISLPSTFGASLPPENLNSLRDRGFELRMGTSGKSGHFSYELSGNLSWARAKWLRFEEPEYTDPDQRFINRQTGNWTDRLLGYDADGLFTSQSEIDNLPYTYAELANNSILRPGDVKYKDLNGDGVLDWKDVKVIGKGGTPHWMYGFNTSVSYNNFDLTALLQGAFGFNTFVNLSQFDNATKYALRWTPDTNDPNALVPRVGGAATNGYISDYQYTNTSYLRLKTLSVGYEVPKSLLTRIRAQKLRFYFSGVNLLTFSSLNKYGVDPESPSNNILVYPQQRTLSLGLNLTI